MEIKKKFIINAAFYGIIFLIVLGVYRYILPILMPFIIGFCVAALVQIPLGRIRCSKKLQKNILTILFVIFLYAIIVGILSFFGVKIFRQTAEIFRACPDFIQYQVYPFFTEGSQKIEGFLAPIDPALAQWIHQLGRSGIQSLSQFATDLSAGAVKIVASGAINIPSIIIQIVITVVSSFYIALDYDKVIHFLSMLIPASKQEIATKGLGYAKKAVVVYIRSYSLLFYITFCELWIGLNILGIPYAMGFAFGIAFLDLLPIIGTGGILLPWALILAIRGSWPLALGIFLLYIVIATVRNTLEPRFVGNQIGLHPLATLVAMILGLKLVGLVGMILFPITLVAIVHLRRSGNNSFQPDINKKAAP